MIEHQIANRAREWQRIREILAQKGSAHIDELNALLRRHYAFYAS